MGASAIRRNKNTAVECNYVYALRHKINKKTKRAYVE